MENKLIVLYGFAASGKTTLAKLYIDEHPLALAFEGDSIIGMMGQWRKYESEARRIIFEHTKSIIRNQLLAGKDVIIPYLLTEASDSESFENIAHECGVEFIEVYIKFEKEEAVENLLRRGVWGEEGSPQLTKNDLPEIYKLYETMASAMEKRDRVKIITSTLGDIEGAYKSLLTACS